MVRSPCRVDLKHLYYGAFQGGAEGGSVGAPDGTTQMAVRCSGVALVACSGTSTTDDAGQAVDGCSCAALVASSSA